MPYDEQTRAGLERFGFRRRRRFRRLSRAAASGVHPAVMQKLAGHSSARTTMDIYTHVNVDAKRAAMEIMQMEFM